MTLTLNSTAIFADSDRDESGGEAPAVVDELMRHLEPSPTDAFQSWIRSDSFPCVGAKAALVRDRITVVELGDITSPTSDVELYRALRAYTETLERDTPAVQSFAAVFPDSPPMTEVEFETALWERLQCLHNFDAVLGEEWAPDTSRDPESAHFGMSIGGEAYFVVGLHPHASRPARCFRYPVLVFNSHDQFERMREDGRFDQMKKIIRKRDTALAGGINPMLDDFGDSSEALQYSGRRLGENWKCPFSAKTDVEVELHTEELGKDFGRGSRRS